MQVLNRTDSVFHLASEISECGLQVPLKETTAAVQRIVIIHFIGSWAEFLNRNAFNSGIADLMSNDIATNYIEI